MATISYQLKGGITGYAGGVIHVDDYRDYNVGANLTAGSGTITVDADDSALVNALDSYWALQRSGSGGVVSGGEPLLNVPRRSYVGTTQPTGMSVGDLWFKVDSAGKVLDVLEMT